MSNPEAKRYADEAAAERKARKALEAELKKFQDAQLSDLEKLQKQHEAVSKQAETYRAKIAQMAVQIEAQKLGIVDPEVAAKLIADQLDLGDDGAPTNAEALLKELIKAKPYLVGQSTGQTQQQRTPAANSGGATNPGRSAGNGGLTPEIIAAMPVRERMARMQEIDAWVKANPEEARAWAAREYSR